MKPKEPVHLPRISELIDFLFEEGKRGVAEARDVIVEEGWFDRTTSSVTNVSPSLGWELPEDRRSEPRNEDPFVHRWSASDQARQPAERDHPHELDFDR